MSFSRTRRVRPFEALYSIFALAAFLVSLGVSMLNFNVVWHAT